MQWIKQLPSGWQLTDTAGAATGLFLLYCPLIPRCQRPCILPQWVRWSGWEPNPGWPPDREFPMPGEIWVHLFASLNHHMNVLDTFPPPPTQHVDGQEGSP